MSADQMREVAQASSQYEEVIALEGFNTTVNEAIRQKYGVTGPGGISGDPLRELAHAQLITLHEVIDQDALDIDLIGAGGIGTPEDAIERLGIGPRVKAVQLFSALLNEGFGLIPRILAAIADMAA